jgi:hypothetical protein
LCSSSPTRRSPPQAHSSPARLAPTSSSCRPSTRHTARSTSNSGGGSRGAYNLIVFLPFSILILVFVFIIFVLLICIAS